MRSLTIATSALLLGLSALAGASALAQQVQVTTPYHSINDSFYENFGIGWGGINRMGANGGWFFNGLPANSTPPPFGGYDPAADARFGFRAGPFSMNLLAGQGSSRSHVMQAPTIVIPNGGSGYFFDGSVSPFVMGVVPVVGGGGMMPAPMATSTSPLAERLERIQQSGGISSQLNATAADQIDPAEAADGKALPPARDDAPLVIRRGRVVDSQPAPASGSAAPADSTANRGDLSLREIQLQQTVEDAARQREVYVLIEKARGKEAEGKPGVARIYYQQAAARAEGDLKQQLLAKADSLGSVAPAR